MWWQAKGWRDEKKEPIAKDHRTNSLIKSLQKSLKSGIVMPPTLLFFFNWEIKEELKKLMETNENENTTAYTSKFGSLEEMDAFLETYKLPKQPGSNWRPE